MNELARRHRTVEAGLRAARGEGITMVAKSTPPDTPRGDTGPDGAVAIPGTPPEAALGIWLSWLRSHVGASPGQETATHTLPPWLVPPEALTGGAATAPLDQFRDFLAT